MPNEELQAAIHRLPDVRAMKSQPASEIFATPRGNGLDNGREIADALGAETAMNTTNHANPTNDERRPGFGQSQQPQGAEGGLVFGRMSLAIEPELMTPRGFEPVDFGSGGDPVNVALDDLLDLALRELRGLRGRLTSGASHGISDSPRGPGR